jgi:antitoxin (DNA-binding transcriptional repressor) of toxin-antitoxin stability system
VKTVPMEDATLDRCIAEAQQERVILTRNGDPIALVVGVQGMDEEQIRLSSSLEFWNLIEESRRQKTISRQDSSGGWIKHRELNRLLVMRQHRLV